MLLPLQLPSGYPVVLTLLVSSPDINLLVVDYVCICVCDWGREILGSRWRSKRSLVRRSLGIVELIVFSADWIDRWIE